MKQRKLNEAKEELLRALLLMKYDTKKTLTENQKNIKNPLKEDVPGVAAGSAVGGAAVGAGYGALASAGALGGLGTGAAGVSMAVGAALLPASVGTGTAVALGASVLGGAAALAVLPLVYWFIRKDTGAASNVKAIFQMCSTNPSISKLERKISDSEIRNIADEIYRAINHSTLGFMAGTDESKLYEAFQNVSKGTAADVCALYARYTLTRGELYDQIDGDIDSPDEWEEIYIPIRNCVEDSLKDMVNDNPCKEGEIWNEKTKSCVKINGGGGGVSKWKDCPNFPLTKGCKGEKVEKIQNCLRISVDGKFGSETEKTISDKGYSTPVTQEVYDKIIANCGGSQQSLKTTKNPLDGEQSLDIENGEVASLTPEENPES